MPATVAVHSGSWRGNASTYSDCFTLWASRSAGASPIGATTEASTSAVAGACPCRPLRPASSVVSFNILLFGGRPQRLRTAEEPSPQTLLTSVVSGAGACFGPVWPLSLQTLVLGRLPRRLSMEGDGNCSTMGKPRGSSASRGPGSGRCGVNFSSLRESSHGLQHLHLLGRRPRRLGMEVGNCSMAAGTAAGIMATAWVPMQAIGISCSS